VQLEKAAWRIIRHQRRDGIPFITLVGCLALARRYVNSNVARLERKDFPGVTPAISQQRAIGFERCENNNGDDCLSPTAIVPNN
jgi:hypothetical protein